MVQNLLMTGFENNGTHDDMLHTFWTDIIIKHMKCT
jgi:hypothetical protein